MTTLLGSPTTVVICDDHLVLAEGLAALLTAEADITVAGIAGTVAEVMAMVERFQPHVVLIDYELPDGNGVGATRALKQAHPEVQVVMLTSYNNQEVLVAALEAGCSGYLTKQGGAQKVADAIRHAAAGEPLITALMLQQLLPQLKATKRGIGAQLTDRELEILEYLADGASGQAIADRLFLSSNTIRNHVQSILIKLGVHSRLEAVAVAVQEGVIRRT